MTAKGSGWYSLHRLKFPIHSSPALSIYCCQGLTKPLLILSNISKTSQRKEGGKPSCERWVWVIALSRGTITELKCQGAWMGSHCWDQGGEHWPPPLKSGLSLKRSKSDADHCERITLRGGTWEENGWASHLPSRGALVRAQNLVCTGPWQVLISQAS